MSDAGVQSAVTAAGKRVNKAGKTFDGPRFRLGLVTDVNVVGGINVVDADVSGEPYTNIVCLGSYEPEVDDGVWIVDMGKGRWMAIGSTRPQTDADTNTDMTPAGIIKMFGGDTAPSGYLFCDGSLVSRSTYAALFSAIGTKWGAGDGSTTFSLPDLREKTAVGWGGPAFGAFNVTHEVTAYDSTDANSYTTGTFDVAAGRLVLVWVTTIATGTPATPTISGLGVTWTQEATVLYSSNVRRMTLFSGVVASTQTAQALTITASTSLGCAWSVVSMSGHHNVGYIVQKPTNSGTSATSGSVTLAAAGNSANRAFACFHHRASEGTTPRTNWTEIGDANGADPNTGIESQWRSDAFETTASATWTTSSDWGGIAVEVKAGVNDADFDTVGESGGEKTHLLTASESGTTAHGHTGSTVAITDPGHTHPETGGGSNGYTRRVVGSGSFDNVVASSGVNTATFTNPPAASNTTGITATPTIAAASAASAASAHNNMPPYAVVMYVIKT